MGARVASAIFRAAADAHSAASALQGSAATQSFRCLALAEPNARRDLAASDKNLPKCPGAYSVNQPPAHLGERAPRAHSTRATPPWHDCTTPRQLPSRALAHARARPRQARFTEIYGPADPARVYTLPTITPPADGMIVFEFKLNPAVATGGKMVMVAGLEVRACA